MGCTFHTLSRVKGLDAADPRDREASEAAVIGCSDAIVTSCVAEAEEVVELYGADPARVAVIAPGVDHAFFGSGSRTAARRAIGLESSGPVALWVGRIQPLKGLDVAVDAFALLPHDVQLVVVGGASGPEGPRYLERIQRRARSLGIAHRIRWVAPQPHEMLSSYYRAADVVLVPSRSESFGLVALEAAACGAPVVASPVGGLRTLVIDGCTGFVRPRTADAFADAASLLVGDPALAAEMGRQAAQRASRFTWSGAALRVEALFDELAERAPVLCV